MLKGIAIVTLVVRSLAGVEPAYEEELGYEAVGRGRVGPELARAWDAPAMAGRRYVLLQPESGEEPVIRIIEAPSGAPVPRPFLTHGWNAAELLVTDPDALAARLPGGAFRVIGEPRNLTAGENAPRAMQALGPAEEPLYLTRFIPGGGSLDLGSARTPVDRVFIMVVGGPSLEALRAFYRDTLGLPITEFGQWQISVLSKAHGLPPQTRFPLAGARLPSKYMIEIDEYPAGATARKRAPGALPGGWSMVSFNADRLEGIAVSWRSPPRPISAPPYAGRTMAVTAGPAGEWIEVIEDTAPGPAD